MLFFDFDKIMGISTPKGLQMWITIAAFFIIKHIKTVFKDTDIIYNQLITAIIELQVGDKISSIKLQHRDNRYLFELQPGVILHFIDYKQVTLHEEESDERTQ